MNTSKFYKLAYSYLGYRNVEPNEHIDKLIEESLEEVKKLSQFQYICQEFDYKLDFIKNNQVYLDFLDGTTSYYLVLMTLGKRIDDRCRYYSKIDMEKMVVFDACSSAYLELSSDEFEEDFPNPHTYRFCPGYQGTSTSDIREIFKYIDNKKIGVDILDSNLMVPLKTMCGIIGIGKQSQKSCKNCTLLGKCEYKKENRTCY